LWGIFWQLGNENKKGVKGMLKLEAIEQDRSKGKVTPIKSRRVVGIIERMAKIVAQDGQGRGLRLIDDESEEIARVEYLDDGIKVIMTPGMLRQIKTRVKRIYSEED